MSQRPIFVTKPYLPPLEEFLPYLEQIWESRQLTNGGPFHQQLEQALEEYLRIPNISLFCNGTVALITAQQALRITGEVITTPFTFVATAHALHWNNIKPVFVDIDPHSFTLNPDCIEAAITPQTTAILAVHVYGNPCDVDAIQEIANRYGLKVIYDAAHSFGSECHCGKLLQRGNLSILSFHATKVFHTFEGGAVVCPDPQTKQRIDYLKNFGFAGETKIVAPGINGKMNELQAAMGLLQLQHMEQILAQREAIDTTYRQHLTNIQGITLPHLPMMQQRNYSYFPILIEKEYPLNRDALYEHFKNKEIFTRRYFYPLASNFVTYRGLESAKINNLPIANQIAEKVLCLPIYPDLSLDEVEQIIGILKNPV